jgi:hypothetical protein
VCTCTHSPLRDDTPHVARRRVARRGESSAAIPSIRARRLAHPTAWRRSWIGRHGRLDGVGFQRCPTRGCPRDGDLHGGQGVDFESVKTLFSACQSVLLALAVWWRAHQPACGLPAGVHKVLAICGVHRPMLEGVGTTCVKRKTSTTHACMVQQAEEE